MIAKHIAMNHASRSSALRLVEYITSTRDKAHRVGEVFLTNCLAETPDMAALEMRAVQDANTRAKGDKTYHLLLSFRPGEEPTRDQLRDIEAAVCAELGFADHQRVAVVHRDTDSLHLHVAINKIHPTRRTMREPFRDYVILAKIGEALEKRHGLKADNHVPTGKTAGERRAADLEAMTGQESLLSWIRRECLPALRAATSWEELHGAAAKAGLALSPRGNGMVFAAVSGEMVKASDVDRDFSKAKLEKRFGPFRPCGARAGEEAEKTYRKEPLYAMSPLKAEFERIRAAAPAARTAGLAEIRAEQRRSLEAIRAENRLDRLNARRIRVGRFKKRELYGALKAKYRRQMTTLHDEFGRRRREVMLEHPRHTWLSWLQEQAMAGREDAIKALRARAFDLARKAGTALRGEHTAGPDLLPGGKMDGVTKRGSVIYRVGDDALRDDGESFRLSRSAGLDTAILALKLARDRYGEALRIDGDAAFRDWMVQAAVAGGLRLRFADPWMEARRAELARARSQSGQSKKRGNELS